MEKWIKMLSKDEKKQYLFPVLYHLIEKSQKQEGEVNTLSVKKIAIKALNTTQTMGINFYKPISKI